MTKSSTKFCFNKSSSDIRFVVVDEPIVGLGVVDLINGRRLPPNGDGRRENAKPPPLFLSLSVVMGVVNGDEISGGTVGINGGGDFCDGGGNLDSGLIFSSSSSVSGAVSASSCSCSVVNSVGKSSVVVDCRLANGRTGLNLKLHNLTFSEIRTSIHETRE